MGNLTANLSTAEFVCRCGCGQVYVAPGLAELVQEVRDHFQNLMPDWDARIYITSGTRCKKWNRVQHGSPTSRHLPKWAGKKQSACDFFIYDKKQGMSVRIATDDVAAVLEAKCANSHGIGRYYGRVHIDNRPTAYRWDKRNAKGA